MGWLAETPLAVVKAHAEMLPRLLAEESLRESSRVAVGSRLGHGDRARVRTAERSIRQWERDANAGRRRPRAPRATRADLAALGIGVRTPEVKRG